MEAAPAEDETPCSTLQQPSDCSKVSTHCTMFTLGGCALQLCSHLRKTVQKMNGLPQLSSCLDPLRQVFAAKHQCCRSEHSDDAVCPGTPSLYLSMDPNITHHTDLKIHLSARHCTTSITQNYSEGKRKAN